MQPNGLILHLLFFYSITLFKVVVVIVVVGVGGGGGVCVCV